jgi:ribosomal protein L37AE/L43A
MGTLKKCRYCNKYGLTQMSEAGHTRLYYCPNCEKKTTQYLKKIVRCTKCGHQKTEKYV